MSEATLTANLLTHALRRSVRYLEAAQCRRVSPPQADVDRLPELGGPIPQRSSDPERVLAMLDEIASPATVINVAGRYFGFVNGGTLPVALAADWLTSTWDQNAGLETCSPAAAALEEITI